MAAVQPDFRATDLYKVLGVSRHASAADIHKAYKKAALRCHPDKNQHDQEQAEKAFKRVSEAYRTLSDVAKRKHYDTSVQKNVEGNEGARFHAGGPGISQEQSEVLFRSLFGGGSKGAGLDPFVFMSPGSTGSGPKGGVRGAQFNFDRSKDHINIDIGTIFAGLGGSRTSKRNGERPQQSGCVLPVGTSVAIRGSADTPGTRKAGTVKGFDDESTQYKVRMEESGDIDLVKPKNLTQRCCIEIVGLENKPELNGQLGKVLGYGAKDGRYEVLLPNVSDATSTLSLHRDNVLLKKFTCVVLDGLTNEKFNGEMARIVDVHRPDSRYTVQCRDGNQIKVKFDKVVC